MWVKLCNIIWGGSRMKTKFICNSRITYLHSLQKTCTPWNRKYKYDVTYTSLYDTLLAMSKILCELTDPFLSLPICPSFILRSGWWITGSWKNLREQKSVDKKRIWLCRVSKIAWECPFKDWPCCFPGKKMTGSGPYDSKLFWGWWQEFKLTLARIYISVSICIL